MHVAALNNSCANNETAACTRNADCAGVGGKCGFAGKRDWRLPNLKELQSIVNFENFNPALSPAFKAPCAGGSTVLTGSCTASDYWSSTTTADNPIGAWDMLFFNGDVGTADKGGLHRVRAVRLVIGPDLYSFRAL